MLYRFTNNSPTLTSLSAFSGSPALIKTQKRTIASCMFPPQSKCHDEAPGALLLYYSGEIWVSYQTHRTNRAPPSYANQRYTSRNIDEPPGETGGRKSSEHQVSLHFRQESTHRFRSYKLWRIITGVAIAYYELAASLEGVKLSKVFL